MLCPGVTGCNLCFCAAAMGSPTLFRFFERSGPQPGALHHSLHYHWQQCKAAKASRSRHKHTLAV